MYKYHLVSVRLTNADSQSHVGTVQIFADNRWAEVCDDEWDDDDASVLCRELGFVSGHALTGVSKYEEEFESWVLFKKAFDNVSCTGSETSLLDCPKRRFSASTCRANKLAGVICYNTSLDKVNNSMFL